MHIYDHIPSSGRGWNDPILEHLASLDLQRRERQLLDHPENNRMHLDLFADTERWAHKPYCSNNKTAGTVRSLASALKHQYIQCNPPWMKARIVFDVDRAGESADAWNWANLPEPTWSTINRVSGNGHLVYELKKPVLVHSDTAMVRWKPIRLISIITENFRQRLRADPGYGGLMTRNPANSRWRVVRGAGAYDLGDLAEYVPADFTLPKVKKSSIETPMLGLRRNVELFDGLRAWAYVKVRAAFNGFDDWLLSVQCHADHLNGQFRDPLGAEVGSIARSVAKWVWNKRGHAHGMFIERQAWKGKKGGVASGKKRYLATSSARAEAVSMALQGMSDRAIGRALGVDHATVGRWRRGVVHEP